MERGFVHLYTGDGKGKTTAAAGLALRAAAAGRRVYIGQFVKDMEYGEMRLLRQRCPEVKVERYGEGCFIDRPPGPADKEAALRGLERAGEALASGAWGLVILDEITIALHCGLLSTEAVLALLDRRPAPVELVLTGRYAPQELIARCDLVTEMREIDHYYRRGVLAREGIER
jgi:cob(I)alamin adenosyltransferase